MKARTLDLESKYKSEQDLTKKNTKKKGSIVISTPTNFTHVQHMDNSPMKVGFKNPTSPVSQSLRSLTIGHESIPELSIESNDTKKQTKFSQKLDSVLSNLFTFKTTTARRKALAQQMNEMISEDEKKALKQEFINKESATSRHKNAKMSVNDFEVIKTIGHGGFGVVRLVREKATGEIFAMKCLTKSITVEKHQESHVKNERILLSIASELGEWIVKLVYCFQDPEYLYFVLEYMPGGDLLGLLIKKDIFSESFARHYFAEIVLAIEEVHKLGMIHRDIKPDNFLFDSSGHLKLADFGLASDSRSSPNAIVMADQSEVISPSSPEPAQRRHTAYSVVGTNDYVAPEVLRGNGYDKSCDWWSAGVILFEMLFGYPAFSSSSSSVTKKKILNWEQALVFPPTPVVSEKAKDLIRKLLCAEDKRLGGRILRIPSNDRESLESCMLEEGDASDIKSHSWFSSFEWDDLQYSIPPFIPQLLDGKSDTSHFELVDECSLKHIIGNKNEKSHTDMKFEGFTYIPPKGPMGDVDEFEDKRY
ncbi:kinase-like domain-containing protein [Globomyces pollinis-pini]|nr:kinase-like domain-containing protein [Globomyces pollinis-pini]